MSLFSLPDPVTILWLGLGLLACAAVMGWLHARYNQPWEGDDDRDD